MTNRERELATLMLMANILYRLGDTLTKSVNKFRRDIRKALNKIAKHEKKLYQSSLDLAVSSWEEVNKDEHSNMSVAHTLDSLYLLIEDVKWVRKIFTPKQFMLVYASIVQDKPVPLTAEIEQNSKKFTDELSEALGFKKKNDLKRLIYTLKQNAIIDKG